jgi:L-amino acid N-acyltransferase YncA
MSMAAAIRLACVDDAPQVQAIYSPVVRDTAISFEVDPPDVGEMGRRIRGTLTRLPWLACERDGEVLGFAYAARHRERAAYRWSVDVSVYVDQHARRVGVGRGLYVSLLALLASQRFAVAHAGITLPNPASVGLHEALGFVPVGVYRAVGFKLGAWWDVGWWQRRLGELAVPPAPPVDLPDLPAEAVREALAAGVPLLGT